MSAVFDLAGKRAFVTGGGRGIGRSIAEALAEAGANVAISGRNGAALGQAAEDIARRAGRAVHAVPQNVADAASAELQTKAAAEALGGLDILVNNAGVEDVRPSVDVDEALWDRILDTNLKGAFFCAKSAARMMIAAGQGGSIINLLSLTSETGVPTAAPYGASKSGLLGLTRALAAEWAPHAIRVNGLAPGYFRTALTEPFYADAAWAERMRGKIPLGRFGALEDLAGAAVFLASPASAYITGVILPVDGGILAAL